jgi:hypothetical protein
VFVLIFALLEKAQPESERNINMKKDYLLERVE